MNEKRIAIVIPLLRRGGGAEKTCAWLSRELEKQNWNVHLITFVPRENELTAGGERYVLNPKYQRGIFRLLLNAKKIKHICREQKIEKILAFTEEANAACILAKVFGGKFKLFLAVRNNPEVRGVLSKLFIKLLYRRGSLVIANSLELAEKLTHSFHLPHVHTIHNPVHVDDNLQKANDPLPEDFQDLVKGKYVFLNIARLVHQKGLSHLIRAFKDVRKEGKDCVLLIIGQGMLEKELKNLAKQLNLEDSILFLGGIENVYPYIQRAHCFVFSSLYEGFPNVLLEALSLNKLVIATDCHTGPREVLGAPLKEELQYPFFAPYGILTKPFVGSMVEVEVAEHMFAECMQQAIKENFWKDTYTKGQEKVSQFDPATVLKEWQGVLSL